LIEIKAFRRGHAHKASASCVVATTNRFDVFLSLRKFAMPEQAKDTVGCPEQIELVEAATTDDRAGSRYGNGIATAVTVAAVGIGAAALETALLPGVILGVAAMWLPHDVRQAFAPLARSTVRGVYRIGEKTNELIADVREEIADIVAEVDAEDATA
jgi:hypothetical protein